jgi:hypothetical protein
MANELDTTAGDVRLLRDIYLDLVAQFVAQGMWLEDAKALAASIAPVAPEYWGRP